MHASAGNVLVVDDEEMVLHFIELVLTQAGLRVLTAASGDEALKRCNGGAETIDLALLDVVMPKMDGAELCGMLHELYPRLRILLMSGYDEAEIGRRCGAIDSRGFLKKPFTATELVERVKEMLDRPRTFQA